MNGQNTENKEFINESDAANYFCNWCDEHGYAYEPDDETAGGIGHDYRITLEEATI